MLALRTVNKIHMCIDYVNLSRYTNADLRASRIEANLRLDSVQQGSIVDSMA